MPTSTSPIAQILAYAGVHAHGLVVDGRLGVRLGQNGLEIVQEDEMREDHEQELVMSLRVLTPQDLDLLRIPLALPAPRHDHGWRLDVIPLSLHYR